MTVEAAVRVWEIDRDNTWSFDRPSLAIDLQKLADGTSCDGDFEPSGFGQAKGFSVDSFEMEVTSACFGGSGREEENGWSSMTLWTAMRNGDLYALCPLLPKKWKATSTLIPSLSTSVVSNMACIQDDLVDPDQKRAAQQQYEWVQEIDNQEPISSHVELGPAFSGEVRSRPLTPSAIPKLQGPFVFDGGENELDLDVSDIHVVPAKINAEDMLSGEEEDYADLEGLIQDRLPITVICLATTTGKVLVCLNLDTVSGQWLPQTQTGAFGVPASDHQNLVLVESVQVAETPNTSEDRPLLSQDPVAPYDFYLTSSHRIDHLSLSSWASRLETELFFPGPPNDSMEYRFKVLCNDKIVIADQIIDYAREGPWNTSQHLSQPVFIDDEDVGLLLLSCSQSGPHAISLQRPEDTPHMMVLTRSRTESLSPSESTPQLELSRSSPDPAPAPSRPAYEPPNILYEPPAAPLKNFLSSSIPQRQKKSLHQNISLSPDTLDIMTAAHRILSLQTSQLEQAAAELFRRCERLREEMVDQVKQMTDLATRLDPADSTTPQHESEDRNVRCERRIAKAKDRQRKINERYEALRRKIGRATAGGRELSSKEKAWVREITEIGSDLGLETKMPIDPRDGDDSHPSVQDRYEAVSSPIHLFLQKPKKKTKNKKKNDISVRKGLFPNMMAIFQVKQLGDSLIQEAHEISATQIADGESTPLRSLDSSMASPSARLSTPGIPSKLQKSKVEEAMLMVERETAVIEAVMTSLDRLNCMQIDP